MAPCFALRIAGLVRKDRPGVAGLLHPVRILTPERVEVLLSSAELADRYGEAPVAVLFRPGEGEVFHMISHYYLQGTGGSPPKRPTSAGASVNRKGNSATKIRSARRTAKSA